MIKIEKQIKITIDGDDVQTLGNICEFARRWISKEKENNVQGTINILSARLGINEEQYIEVGAMLEKIFDA